MAFRGDGGRLNSEPAAAPQTSRTDEALRLLATFVVQYVGATLGAALHVHGTNVGIVWPPAGLVLALMLRWGTQTWPAVFFAQLCVSLPTLLQDHGRPESVAAAVVQSLSNVVSLLFAVRWLRPGAGLPNRQTGLGWLARLVGWGGGLAQLLSALIGTSSLWLLGLRHPTVLGQVGIGWWLSNFVSVLVLTPFVLAWWPPIRLERRPWMHGAFYLTCFACSALVFVWLPPSLRGHFVHLTVLLVLAAAFLFGAKGTAATTAILASFAVYGIAAGRGAFSPAEAERELLLLNLYLSVLSITGLVLAAVLEERARAAGELAEGAALLEGVLQAGPLPITWADANGRIGFWSRRAQQVFGYRADEVPTVEAWYRLAYPDPLYRAGAIERWSAAVAAAEGSNAPFAGGEYQIHCRDGSVRTMELFGSFVLRRLLVVFNDVTERLRAEAQREQLHKQLEQVQKMESVGLLAGGIAHDLNNLLMPVLGYTDLLLDDPGQAPETSADLREVKRAAERARDLTQRLLAFGRKQVLDLKVIDLRVALTGMEKLLRRTIREDVRIHLELPPAPAMVRADASQIEQVVMNLAVNAQHAMPHGGELRMSLAAVHVGEGAPADDAAVPPGDWLLLSVRDTGAGIEEAVLGRIFEPFFTTKRSGEGTGLGLAIVDGIVRQHGGQVFVRSAPGKGTTFRIYFPRLDGSAAEEPAHSLRAPATGAARETILLVDDDEGARRITARMLRTLGYPVKEAQDAAACLRLAGDDGAVDLLLTDVVMPEQNGRQLFEQVQRLRPSLKVLYMSGYATEVVTVRGLLLEGMLLLPKPFSLDDLAAAVRRALGDEQAG